VLESLAQQQAARAGAEAKKASLRQSPTDPAYEVASGTLAGAEVGGHQFQAGQVQFACPDIPSGRNTAVVVRCRSIYDTANTNLDSLEEYAVMAKWGTTRGWPVVVADSPTTSRPLETLNRVRPPFGSP